LRRGITLYRKIMELIGEKLDAIYWKEKISPYRLSYQG
jgi:hypothetical protein